MPCPEAPLVSPRRGGTIPRPMPPRLRALLVSLGTLLLALLAHLPLFRAGFLAEDRAALLRALDEPGAPAAAPDASAPLARASLAASSGLRGRSAAAALSRPASWRAEHLVLLCVAALGLRAATRRLLLPWTGSEHAGAAGGAAALLLLVHPLAVFAVASLDARGALLALLLGAWAVAAFLRARQDRVRALEALCLALCALAGMADDAALWLPLVLAGAELFSSHRYRPLRVRLRTAATTLVVFGLASGFEVALRVGRLGAEGLPGFARALGRGGPGASELARRAIEATGLLVLPANAFVTELAGLALAGVAFLLAVHPGLSAARSAPRLWGWMLSLWLLALLAGELSGIDVAVGHADLSAARALLLPAAVAALGLAVGTTALSGLRRVLYPCAVAVAYATLAHANALAWPAAARAAEALRADLLEARERQGTDVAFLVLDPPRRVRGVSPLGDAIAALVHPAFDEADGRESRAPSPRVLGLSHEAFLAFVAEPEFQALRAGGAAVVFPEALVGGARAGEEGTRRSLRLPPPQPSERPLSWRGTLRSPNLDLDALTVRSLVVEARGGLDLARGQRASWRARERSLADGSWPGAWSERDGTLRAVFDLGGSLVWLLGDRVKRVWFEGGLPSLEQATFAADLPGLGELQPEVRGERAWVFPLPRPAVGADELARGRFVVRLLDLASLAAVALPARAEGEELVVERAAELVRGWLRGGGGPVAWQLDLEVEGACVARSRGRRVEGAPDERAPATSG